MKPNTFLIGAPKCGTTALAHYLGEHPQVFFSKPKEPFFWACDIPAAPHELRPRNLDEYLRLFRNADPKVHRVVAEGSTCYLRSASAVPRILEFNPYAKFIAILRDPAEVAHAYHMEQVYVGEEDETDFAAAWRMQDERERGLSLPPNAASADAVLYRKVAAFADQIERLFEVVPSHQRMILLLDDFRSDPAAVYAETLQFLGLEHDGRDSFMAVNSAHAQRFRTLSKFLLHPPAVLAGPLRGLRAQLLNRHVPGVTAVKRRLRVERDREPMDPSVLADARTHFATDVERLAELLGRNLADWNGS